MTRRFVRVDDFKVSFYKFSYLTGDRPGVARTSDMDPLRTGRAVAPEVQA